MVTFTDRNGVERQGEVWSPGPVPRSVWMLLSDGSTVAVYMDKRREILNAPADPRTEPCRCGLVWARGNLVPKPGHNTKAYQCQSCQPNAQARYLTQFRYAPSALKAAERARAVELFRVYA